VRIRGSGSERLSLNPRDHGLDAADCNLDDLDRWRQQALAALRGEGPLAEALAWNLAIQLWLDGRHPDLPAALIGARALLQEARGEALRQALMG
jgi:anthranilate phosphoribosyltransferase